jgi:hypothetical protein
MEGMMPETTAAEAISAIDKWAAKISEVAAQYGPQAADLAVEVGRVGAVQHLLQNAGLVVAGAAVIWFVSRPFARRAAYWAEENSISMYEVPLGLASGLSGAGGLIAIIAGALDLLDPYAWVGLYRPEVFLAAKALGL